MMRLFLRILGTWLLGLTLVLLVIDGTKSLAANDIVFTSFGAIWSGVHSPSLAAVIAFLDGRFFADLLERLFVIILGYPAFAVLGVPGMVLAILGRSRKPTRYVVQDQF
ncbi:hypothetical protein PSQ90_05900 [Devosia rhodophyticola]|uniref:Uncharacterized protein n=1 Tax=Devosia rhodophyticola TaxID=3026423 RepID=A0ABY7Z174_9HYPH|nr:hypothetical protein [Devosia rhodophyticola]WDR06970.1 hypothetical protein PSQ90_05900 [Devosia rhodophyticola]